MRGGRVGGRRCKQRGSRSWTKWTEVLSPARFGYDTRAMTKKRDVVA